MAQAISRRATAAMVVNHIRRSGMSPLSGFNWGGMPRRVRNSKICVNGERQRYRYGDDVPTVRLPY
jgi:hypothetical protein